MNSFLNNRNLEVDASFRHDPQTGGKIHVCHLLPALPAHGAEQLLLDICRHVDYKKFKFSIVLLSDFGPLTEEFVKLGIEVVLIPKKSRKDFTVVYRLAKFWRKRRFDIVHTHLFTADLWGRLAGLLSGISIMSTSHTTSDPNIGRLGLLLDRILSFRNDIVICVSEAVRHYREKVARFSNRKLIVIENGIDLDRFTHLSPRKEKCDQLGLDSSKRWLVIVGRLVPLKGHRYLFDAVSLLIASFPSLGLLVVGEGEEENELKIYADRLGLANHVIFLGQRRDVPDILNLAEIFLLPSSREGLPIVLLEAMAAALPVVVTPVGGIPEVVEEGKTGFFVSQDGISIAKALRVLLEDPGLGQSMGAQGRAIIEERYDIRRTAKRYEALYDCVVHSGKLKRSRSILRNFFQDPPMKL